MWSPTKRPDFFHLRREELAEDVARLASNAVLRERLGSAAGKRAELLFDVPIVVGRMEQLYEDLVA